MRSQILQLDIQGTPQAWISVEQAAHHYATDSVAWDYGQEPFKRLHGGFNARRGAVSVIDVAPIIALRGSARTNLFDVAPSVTRAKLFVRDRFTCAYCASVLPPRLLEAEHIIPAARGGPWTWQNLASSCRGCNALKSCRTPEEAGMPLVYLPYVPSRWEDFLLQGRDIRCDVHEWLASRLPKHSRLL